jgi:hypothetical protein
MAAARIMFGIQRSTRVFVSSTMQLHAQYEYLNSFMTIVSVSYF